jgi:sigma-B regulation protein RsbU (phosphoserine phosphatase)
MLTDGCLVDCLREEWYVENLLTRSGVILDSLSDGVYVCDTERRIVYWSKSAQRITGWHAEDVVGRRCLDDVLNHKDKDGRLLCGEEFCPLHRSIVTGTSSNVPLVVFAQSADGRRVPTQVSVAPIRGEDGEVIGGVETFRDMSAVLADLERAKRIQSLAMESDLPEDARIRFSTFYTPHDIVGGDYYAIRQLDPDRYGFLLADAMGHGVAAALHTIYLSALWNRHGSLVARPAEFAATVNDELARVVKGESFATAVCGVIDAKERSLRFAAAGGPPILVVRPDGEFQSLACPGFPLGMVENTEYEEQKATLCDGETLLAFSDGVTEIENAQGDMLGADGLMRILQGLGYPQSPLPGEKLEEELLKFSNSIRLDDDITLLEARFP